MTIVLLILWVMLSGSMGSSASDPMQFFVVLITVTLIAYLITCVPDFLKQRKKF